VECAVSQALDMELVGIFTRRAPETLKPHSDVKVYAAADLDRSDSDMPFLLESISPDQI